MKHFLTLCAAVVAVAAMPADVGREIDLGREGDIFYENANFTNARVPFGQAGFASMNGGTIGGTGGAIWTVWDVWALRDAVTGTDEARVIYVRGLIDFTPMFSSSPGVRFDVRNFKTIIGGDANAMIYGGGIRVRGARQVIIENIKFHNALSYAPGEQPNGNGGIISLVPGAWSTVDALGVESNSEYVWVNHCEFADDPWIAINTPTNMRRHDGQIDIVRGANWVSISNTVFRNHDLVSLMGSDDSVTTDRGRLKVTWYLNWFQNTIQRNPRIRYGEVHMLNNLYTDIVSYGIGIGVEASIYAERNTFINTLRAWAWPAGVSNPLGYLLNDNNRLVNSGHDSGVTANGVTWRPSNYYQYGALDPANAEAHIRRYAGTY